MRHYTDQPVLKCRLKLNQTSEVGVPLELQFSSPEFEQIGLHKDIGMPPASDENQWPIEILPLFFHAVHHSLARYYLAKEGDRVSESVA